jgi:hypothetical protein
LDPQLQNINNCTPTGFTFSVYIHGSWTLGKPYGTKPRCYWEQLGEHIWEQGKKQIKLISSWVLSKLFLFFWERAIFIGLSTNFLEHWAVPNGSTSLDPSCKIETNVVPYSLPFQYIYMRIELWANHTG